MVGELVVEVPASGAGSAWTTRVRAEARFRRGMRAGSNGRRGQARPALKGNFPGACWGTAERLSRRGASRLRRVCPQLRRSASTRPKSSSSGPRLPPRTCTRERELERIRRQTSRRTGAAAVGAGLRELGAGERLELGRRVAPLDAQRRGWRSAPLNLELHGLSGESTRRALREGSE